MEGAALMCILRVTAPAIIQYHMLRESIGFHILFFGRSTGYSLWFMRPKIFHVSGVFLLHLKRKSVYCRSHFETKPLS